MAKAKYSYCETCEATLTAHTCGMSLKSAEDVTRGRREVFAGKPQKYEVAIERSVTTEVKCPSCLGSGYISAYKHVAGGVCFSCNGWGRAVKAVKHSEVLGRITATPTAERYHWNGERWSDDPRVDESAADVAAAEKWPNIGGLKVRRIGKKQTPGRVRREEY